MVKEKELDDLALKDEKEDDSTLKDNLIPMPLLQDNENIKEGKKLKILTPNSY